MKALSASISLVWWLWPQTGGALHVGPDPLTPLSRALVAAAVEEQPQPAVSSPIFSEVAAADGVPVCSSLIASFTAAYGHPVGAENLLMLVDALSHPSSEGNSDKIAEKLLLDYEPLQDEGRTQAVHNLERRILYGCVLDESTKDNLLLRIYRAGLVKTAGVLRKKGLYSRAQYLYARDAEGDNLMHLIVRNKEADLFAMLAMMLQEDVTWLIARTSFGRNRAKETPIDLALKLKASGLLQRMKNALLTYELQLDPTKMKRKPTKPRTYTFGPL